MVIDLVLSGDNAVVIGMAASRLRGERRRQAIMFGVGGAIGLRVLFTAMVAVLLSIPLLQFFGGVLLVWIAIKLLRPAISAHANVREAATRWDAIKTIVLADVVMSLDNILAVGGAAKGHIELLLFGLALSMPLIAFGSGFIAWLLDRHSWVMYIGAGVLAWTAGAMIAHDPMAHEVIARLPGLEAGIAPSVTLAVISLGFVLRRQRPSDVPLATATPGATGPPSP